MPEVMDWNKLLSPKRLCQTLAPQTHQARSPFQIDYDRICFSSAFRRLQDKTQVFPLPGNDYVRTRLTHSLECSSVGRSLGASVGKELLLAKHVDGEYTARDFGDVVAAACLAHDIGNPPFGHTGEDALRHWFIKSPAGVYIRRHLDNPCHRADLLNYEGNAQGFRLLAKLLSPSNSGGIRLTCATLSTFSKYPKNSAATGGNYKQEKYGFFDADRELFEEVATETGLLRINEHCWVRHPLAFLVEAADDICYHIVDIEDGFKLGCLGFQETCDLLISISGKTERESGEFKEKEYIEYARSKAIGAMVNAVTKMFLDNYKSIMSGDYTGELAINSHLGKSFTELKEVAKKKVYSHKSVVEVEAAGFNVLGTLMSIFFESIEEKYASHIKNIKTSPWSRTILKLIPESYVGPNYIPADSVYLRALMIFDYVSGMTDSYAVSTYKKVQGISLLQG